LQDELFLAYLLYCKNSYIYLDDNQERKNMLSEVLQLKTENEKTRLWKSKISSMKKLKEFLDNNSNILKTNSKLIDAYLPDSYKFKIKNIQEQLSVSVWYLFENIFNLIKPILSINSISNELDEKISKTWKDQNVLGVEYRQGVNKKTLEMFKTHLEKNGILLAFQNPGTKNKDTSLNRVGDVLNVDIKTYKKDHKENKENKKIEENKQNEIELKNQIEFETNKVSKANHYSGIDFFGYEDDPYNGARNFFPLSLQKVLRYDQLKKQNSEKLKRSKPILEWFKPYFRTAK